MNPSNYTILVVDDSDIITTAVDFILKSQGYRVLIAEHGQRAWELLNTEQIDLVLLDESMPEMTGRELCTKMRDDMRLTLIPVVFLTGKAFEMDASELNESLGVRELLGKPFSRAKLLGIVEAILAESVAPA